MKTKSIKKVFIIGAIIAVLLIGSFLLRRFFYDLSDGLPGFSGSISKSKELNVFVCEYKLLNDSICLGRDYLRPGEIWVEKAWVQGNHENPVVLISKNEYDNFRLLIEIPTLENEKFTEYFGLNNRLSILTEEGTYYGEVGAGHKSFFEFTYYELSKDTLKLKIIKRNDTTDKSFGSSKWPNPDIVDEVFLVKKVRN